MRCRETVLKGCWKFHAIVVFILAFLAIRIEAQDLLQGRALLISGAYDECIQQFEASGFDALRSEEWWLLYAQSLLARGRYADAEGAISNALIRFSVSVRLRLVGHDTANATGNPNRAKLRLEQINLLASARSWAYQDTPNLVALGRVALMLGADPKLVLERLYDPSRKASPDQRDPWLATADLALDKGDYEMTSRLMREAMKRFPEDPDVLYRLARAFAPSARGEMIKLLSAALDHNPNHVPSMVLLADHLVDAEAYDEADKILERALEVNPSHPEACAYKAVLAHLRNDPETEEAFRGKALEFWKTNPKVDHIIGVKLSHKYRFAEGSAYQRRALQLDSEFLSAKIQLAQDLLRLGEDEEGWRLAQEVHERDGYDVTAFNLTALRSNMRGFETLTSEHFILRMSREEAALYGDRALALLTEARERLTGKYGIELEAPTIIEIFPDQKDFAVRTLGVPHNPGFLGVCFGRVVTANSPASQAGNPSNWEAVLWHEFAHVITLQLTRNKMPRWLSEGISVYEETLANPAWGQSMNPRYREMILGGELSKVSELSGVFMSPRTPQHIQFAYYQSYLVVDFLIEKFGFEPLKRVLHDLASGVDINEAIPRHTAPMGRIESDFEAFARAKAEALGPGLNWARPQPERMAFLRQLAGAGLGGDPLPRVFSPSDGRSENEDDPPHPAVEPPPAPPSAGDALPKKNYWSLMEEAQQWVAEGEWEWAEETLKLLVEQYPGQSGPGNAYSMLAAVYRGMERPALEREALAAWAVRDAAAPAAYLRLMELGQSEGQWAMVAENAHRFLAVNPLIAQPYRFLARAGEELGRDGEAMNAYQKLLLLAPPDTADVHFRLATLMRRAGDPAAKRHVLSALENAPRFRDAHRLLLDLAERPGAAPESEVEDRGGAAPSNNVTR